MQFFTVSKRGESLAAEFVRLEPHFALQTKTLERLFDAVDAGEGSALPDSLVDLRRRATQENWAKGRPSWNSHASRQIQFMRRLGEQRSMILLLQQLVTADFSGATLDEGFDACDATFAGDLLLVGASLGGALRLDGARLLAAFDASEARIGHEFSAEQTQFVGPVLLRAMDTERALRFGFSEFMSNLTLDGARIGEELWLRNGRIGGELSAREMRLGRDAGLGACTYCGPVTFEGASFGDSVSFEGATFKQALSLDGCAFAGRVRLDGVSLAGGLSVRGTRFAGDIIPPLHEIISVPSPQREMVEKLRSGDFR